MSHSGKTLLSTWLAVAMAFGAVGMAYAAMPAAKQNALNQVPISATQAIKQATATVAGDATEVDFKHKNGAGYYAVDILAGGEKHEVKIDAKSGEVLSSKQASHKKTVQKPTVAVSLSQAIDIALAKTGGKVKEAELKYKDGTPRYKVETLAGGQEYDTIVDAGNGNIISSQADSD